MIQYTLRAVLLECTPRLPLRVVALFYEEVAINIREYEMSVAVNRAGVIDRLVDIVGPEYVNSPNVEGFAAARDQYHPYYGDPAREPLADLHVQPASLDELRELVAVANELRQPLWVNSRGRNYGYGGASRRRPGRCGR